MFQQKVEPPSLFSFVSPPCVGFYVLMLGFDFSRNQKWRKIVGCCLDLWPKEGWIFVGCCVWYWPNVLVVLIGKILRFNFVRFFGLIFNCGGVGPLGSWSFDLIWYFGIFEILFYVDFQLKLNFGGCVFWFGQMANIGRKEELFWCFVILGSSVNSQLGEDY